MKTLDTTIVRNVTTSHARPRLLLTLAGIATAVLCSFALQNDVPRTKGMNAEVFQLLKISDVATKNLVRELKARL